MNKSKEYDMVNTFGIIKVIGYALVATIIIGFVFGLVLQPYMDILVVTLFIISHLIIGLISPIYNKKAPYFACYIVTVSFNVINYIVGYYVLHFDTLSSPDRLNRNMCMSLVLALSVCFFFIKYQKKKEHSYA